ncbi:helix-turn-helix domain-containing protein [Chryseobacterium sp.]|uniref:helix-turn-helix domain-containing protein n=1 Tax=Chryseobacterium sp. TaxID=1871047 RepID=UPI0025BFAFAB|nr:helix-turn-helix domain-containing protein [Chryseobacterium sp.]MBV8325024.1 AraC family transcriptional regulator [Chryseobacterium sp.]
MKLKFCFLVFVFSGLLYGQYHVDHHLEKQFYKGALAIALLLIIRLYFKSKRSEKKHPKITQDHLHSIYKKAETENNKKEDFQDRLTNPVQSADGQNKINRVTSEEVANDILKELHSFEAKELFLKKGITLDSLAKQIKTNSRYLSEVINIYKAKNFATYLNDLRIDYAIGRLAEDQKFRSYKIPFIAEELGYNNEQAFAMAFKKRTGTTVSNYLKK